MLLKGFMGTGPATAASSYADEKKVKETTVHLKTNGDIKTYPLNDEEIKVKYISDWLAKH